MSQKRLIPHRTKPSKISIHGETQHVELIGISDSPLPLSPDMAFIIAMLLASLNSCCNPWIYMFFAGRLFQHLAQGFFCCRKHDVMACSCDRQCQHKNNSGTCVTKNTSSQRSLARTYSTGAGL